MTIINRVVLSKQGVPEDIRTVFSRVAVSEPAVKSLWSTVSKVVLDIPGAANAMHDVNAVVSTARDEMQSSRLVTLDNASIDKRHQIALTNIVDNERVSIIITRHTTHHHKNASSNSTCISVQYTHSEIPTTIQIPLNPYVSLRTIKYMYQTYIPRHVFQHTSIHTPQDLHVMTYTP